MVVFFGVKFVGEVAQAHTQFEGQPAVYARCDGKVDERVKGKHFA